MPLDPINREASSLSELAYAKVLEALLSGALAPGDRLVQDALAEQLGVSRTPLRDALLRLAREGIVVANGNRGFVVPELTADDVRELYEVREAIEGHAARLTARRGPAAIDEVEAKLRKLAHEPTDSGPAAYHANRLAHRAILEAAGNRYLLGVFDDLWGRAVSLRIWGNYYSSSTAQIDLLADHADLLEQLRSGSPDAAARAMVEHVQEGLHRHDLTGHGVRG